MTVKVLKVNDGEGQVLLTYKRLAAEKGNERLERSLLRSQKCLKATVSQVLGGGLMRRRLKVQRGIYPGKPGI